MNSLFKKYDVAVPRYTSYPTVPYWSRNPSREEWIEQLRLAAQNPISWSIYAHIPFCESLCTFCGCNTAITKDHSKEAPYVDLLLNEISLYRKLVPELFKNPLRQLHLGGGSPTFLSAAALAKLCSAILEFTKKDTVFEGSIEVDPRRTSIEQLSTLRKLGFNRVSMGVQDFDPEVQRLVNRIQPLEITRSLTEKARSLGYDSVNFDLIYGLAKQSLASMEKTIRATLELKPDRIALYSFALVPWIKPAQRLFKDEDLPKAEEKRVLYELARTELLKGGYLEIGMDHFALPSEALSKSMKNGKLHRNFMGYTDIRTQVLLGLGVSAISETPTCFHQNEKVLPIYERLLKEEKIPLHRGHLLDNDDQTRREQILCFMTNGKVRLNPYQQEDAKNFLAPMIEDGLVSLSKEFLELTDKGKPFLRNACVFFDAKLRTKEPDKRIFSSSI